MKGNSSAGSKSAIVRPSLIYGASILLALYIVVARRTGRDVVKLSGTIQNDVLKG